MEQKSKSYFLLLLALLSVKALWAIFMILYGQIQLSPDEAQYWTWSKQLDWGYYSKPPGIAWQIAAGTFFFGDSELGIRAGALIISLMTSIALYFLGKNAGLTERASFWTAVTLTFSLIGMAGACAATTDGGFVLFWILAWIILAKGWQEKQVPNFIVFGLLVMAGALFKWTIYAIWVPVVLSCIWQRGWFSKGMWIGILVSFLGLLPSVLWNYSHDWATFRHVGAQILGSSWGKSATAVSSSTANPFDFFVSQVVLFSPFFFFLLLVGLKASFQQKTKIPSAIFYSAAAVLLILGSYQLLSFFQKIQANWATYLYPLASLIVGWYAVDFWKKGRRFLLFSTAFSLAIVVGVTSIPLLQSGGFVSSSTKINPFKHQVGWELLSQRLNEVGYKPERHFLASDKYQMSSILSFYSPGKQRAYFLNLYARRNNQFTYWPSLADEQTGRSGFFVISEYDLLDNNKEESIKMSYFSKLAPHFASVEFAGVFFLTKRKWAMIFICNEFNGNLPKNSFIF